MTQSTARGRRYGFAAAALVLACGLMSAPAGARPEPSCTRSLSRVERGSWAMRPVRGIEGGYPGWRMAIDPADPRLVVVADSAGVLVSRDGGCRWTRALTFDDVAPEWSLRAEDAEVVRGPRGRSLHVLTLAAGNARVLLLSSSDDGRTWSATEPPLESSGVTPHSAGMAADPSGSGALYLHVRHNTTTGALLASDDAGSTWRWTALTTYMGPSGACLPTGACTGPSLLEFEAVADEVWGLAAASPGAQERLVTSADGGSSWSDVDIPALNGGAALLDVAPAPAGDPVVLLMGSFGEFALSRDAGASWEVGEVPAVSDGAYTTSSSYDSAHTSGGRWFATLVGDGPGLWSGNVLLFDGREWENVAPEEYVGLGRRDDDGNPLHFLELTGGRDSFSMLSSRGLLATFRPRR